MHPVSCAGLCNRGCAGQRGGASPLARASTTQDTCDMWPPFPFHGKRTVRYPHWGIIRHIPHATSPTRVPLRKAQDGVSGRPTTGGRNPSPCTRCELHNPYLRILKNEAQHSGKNPMRRQQSLNSVRLMVCYIHCSMSPLGLF